MAAAATAAAERRVSAGSCHLMGSLLPWRTLVRTERRDRIDAPVGAHAHCEALGICVRWRCLSAHDGPLVNHQDGLAAFPEANGCRNAGRARAYNAGVIRVRCRRGWRGCVGRAGRGCSSSRSGGAVMVEACAGDEKQ